MDMVKILKVFEDNHVPESLCIQNKEIVADEILGSDLSI